MINVGVVSFDTKSDYGIVVTSRAFISGDFHLYLDNNDVDKFIEELRARVKSFLNGPPTTTQFIPNAPPSPDATVEVPIKIVGCSARCDSEGEWWCDKCAQHWTTGTDKPECKK